MWTSIHTRRDAQEKAVRKAANAKAISERQGMGEQEKEMAAAAKKQAGELQQKLDGAGQPARVRTVGFCADEKGPTPVLDRNTT